MVGTYQVSSQDTASPVGGSRGGSSSGSRGSQSNYQPQSPYSIADIPGGQQQRVYNTRQSADMGALGNTTFTPANYMANALSQQNSLSQQMNGNLGAYNSFLQANNGPQQVLLNYQLDLLQKQAAEAPDILAHNQNSLRTNTGLEQQLLDLQRQGLGLESGVAKGQLSNLGRLRDILAKQRGLTREQLDNQLGQLKVDETQLRDNSSRQQWDLRSNLTQRGAFNTLANERGTGRINRDLNYGLEGIQHQRTSADIQFRNSLLGLDEKGISYDNQELGLNAKLSQVGLDAKALGIKSEQLNNALADGLYNLGLQGQTSLINILGSMIDNGGQYAALGSQILQQLIQYSNLPPDQQAAAIAAIRAANGGGSAPVPGPATTGKNSRNQ